MSDIPIDDLVELLTSISKAAPLDRYAPYPHLSTGLLRKLHGALREAFDTDEATPDGKPKRHGVREYADWREQCDRLEEQLRKRNEQFTPVPW